MLVLLVLVLGGRCVSHAGVAAILPGLVLLLLLLLLLLRMRVRRRSSGG